MVFVFVGPEMSQEERQEEAEATYEYERMRAQGVSLQEIGAGRVKMEKTSEGDVVATHIDEVGSSDDKLQTERRELA